MDKLFIIAAKQYTDRARKASADMRRQYPGEYFKHRGCEVIPLDRDGYRHEGVTVDYLDNKQVSGRAVARIVEGMHDEARRLGYGGGFGGISLDGGLDCYESWHLSMEYPDDYEPLVTSYESDPVMFYDDDEAAQLLEVAAPAAQAKRTTQDLEPLKSSIEMFTPGT